MKKFEIGKIFGKWTSLEGQEFVMAEMDVDMYHNKGVGYLHAKKYEEAAEMFRKEIGCQSGGELGYWFLGKALQAMGKKEEAKKNYEIALKNAEQMNRQYPDSVGKESIVNIKKDIASLEV
jgi:tetratricopeptide (TPR) repeat protein